jgi:hypothetical protein
LVASLNDSTVKSELELYCNRNFDTVDELLGSMLDVLNTLAVAIQRTLDLVRCERIVPIYTSLFYDGTCSYSMNAVIWLFSGLLMISFFGLLMITLRSAYQPTMYVTVDEDDVVVSYKDGDPMLVSPGDDIVVEVAPNSIQDYGLKKNGGRPVSPLGFESNNNAASIY